MKKKLRASNLGFEEATIELADRYENGLGIEQNTPEAIKLYEKVGYYYRIGELYRDGIGIDRDYDLALRYFVKAFTIHRDSEAKKQIAAMQTNGKSYYENIPKRGLTIAEQVRNNPILSSMRLSANWDDLNEYMKIMYIKLWMDEKTQEWGEERALQVASHFVDIGFTREQLTLSQGWNYIVRKVQLPNVNIYALEYPHCTYYLENDEIFAMIWGNGLQIGNVRLIEKYNGDFVITQ